MDADALRQLFADLRRYDLDTFATTADGGATISNPRSLATIVVGPVTRNVQIPVTTTLGRALDQIIEIFRAIENRFPTPGYLAVQTNIIAHLPVTEETAGDVLDRHAFACSDAFETLGDVRLGTGLKVLVGPTGQTQVLVEPLIAARDQLFVQLMSAQQLQMSLADAQAVLSGNLHYFDAAVRGFLAGLFREQ